MKQKVYIVKSYRDFEPGKIIAVYDSKDKAEARVEEEEKKVLEEDREYVWCSMFEQEVL